MQSRKYPIQYPTEKQVREFLGLWLGEPLDIEALRLQRDAGRFLYLAEGDGWVQCVGLPGNYPALEIHTGEDQLIKTILARPYLKARESNRRNVERWIGHSARLGEIYRAEMKDTYIVLTPAEHRPSRLAMIIRGELPVDDLQDLATIRAQAVDLQDLDRAGLARLRLVGLSSVDVAKKTGTAEATHGLVTPPGLLAHFEARFDAAVADRDWPQAWKEYQTLRLSADAGAFAASIAPHRPDASVLLVDPGIQQHWRPIWGQAPETERLDLFWTIQNFCPKPVARTLELEFWKGATTKDRLRHLARLAAQLTVDYSWLGQQRFQDVILELASGGLESRRAALAASLQSREELRPGFPRVVFDQLRSRPDGIPDAMACMLAGAKQLAALDLDLRKDIEVVMIELLIAADDNPDFDGADLLHVLCERTISRGGYLSLRAIFTRENLHKVFEGYWKATSLDKRMRLLAIARHVYDADDGREETRFQKLMDTITKASPGYLAGGSVQADDLLDLLIRMADDRIKTNSDSLHQAAISALPGASLDSLLAIHSAALPLIKSSRIAPSTIKAIEDRVVEAITEKLGTLDKQKAPAEFLGLLSLLESVRAGSVTPFAAQRSSLSRELARRYWMPLQRGNDDINQRDDIIHSRLVAWLGEPGVTELLKSIPERDRTMLSIGPAQVRITEKRRVETRYHRQYTGSKTSWDYSAVNAWSARVFAIERSLAETRSQASQWESDANAAPRMQRMAHTKIWRRETRRGYATGSTTWHEEVDLNTFQRNIARRWMADLASTESSLLRELRKLRANPPSSRKIVEHQYRIVTSKLHIQDWKGEVSRKISIKAPGLDLDRKREVFPVNITNTMPRGWKETINEETARSRALEEARGEFQPESLILRKARQLRVKALLRRIASNTRSDAQDDAAVLRERDWVGWFALGGPMPIREKLEKRSQAARSLDWTGTIPKPEMDAVHRLRELIQGGASAANSPLPPFSLPGPNRRRYKTLATLPGVHLAPYGPERIRWWRDSLLLTDASKKRVLVWKLLAKKMYGYPGELRDPQFFGTSHGIIAAINDKGTFVRYAGARRLSDSREPLIGSWYLSENSRTLRRSGSKNRFVLRADRVVSIEEYRHSNPARHSVVWGAGYDSVRFLDDGPIAIGERRALSFSLSGTVGNVSFPFPPDMVNADERVSMVLAVYRDQGLLSISALSTGERLLEIRPSQGSLVDAVLSPCGRFVALETQDAAGKPTVTCLEL